MNKTDFINYGNYINCKNTFGQSFGLDYTRVFSKRYLLSAGVEMGYQNYIFTMNAPFDGVEYTTFINGGQRNINSTIYTFAANVNAGYRFRSLGAWQPEIRMGGKLQSGLNNADLFSLELVGNNETYKRNGRLGKLNSFSAEMINFIYVGSNIPTRIRMLNMVSLGLKVQRKFLFSNNPFNYFNTLYTDQTGSVEGTAKYTGRETAISVVIGYTF